ncbi:phosphohexomutase domain-containing protein [Microlunatus soli]|uniref:Phosphomannomutase n=1 Tax=Microlunatus soli TaxID=630515 RepID=A0A1H1XHE0_9ACTN|nr:phosphomannomutase/phosphoglucomutase [Microlunatus soli]SDT08658.1 phosphomannomutase [Microlunatus soli]
MIDPEIFKANDIRGITGPGGQWDADGAYAIGAATAEVLSLAGRTIVLGRDMRTSSPEYSAAFARGVRDRGVNVIDVGLSSTDQLWFCSGRLDLHGVMFTASHNPGQYNGVKFCRPGALPVDSTILAAIKDRALAADAAGPADPVSTPGTLESRDLLADYAEHLHALVDTSGLRRLRVVADAGNGMAGHTLPAVLGGDAFEVIGLYTDPDGSFPNHAPNPLEPENLLDAQAAVREHDADLALVFDGDADRCFIIDEQGEVVSPSTVTAMIAVQELGREPGATIVRNIITSRTVPEVVAEQGGTCVTTRVGHTFVKAAMAETGAIFGGEHSAHYYFRDFWGADTGMLAGLHVLALVGRSDQPLSQLAKEFSRYAASGEINSTVADASAMLDRIEKLYADQVLADGGEIDRSDGLTVSTKDWWFNLRASNTEPLLRFNAESVTQSLTDKIRDDVLKVVRS